MKIPESWIPSIGLGAVVLLVISMSVILHLQQTFFRQDAHGRDVELKLPHDVSRPGLAMELAANTQEVLAVLDAGSRTPAEKTENRNAMRWIQYWDFPFIAGYMALYLVIARRAGLLGFAPLIPIAWLAGLTAVAAGAADIMENIAILLAVNANGMGALTIRHFGWWKWMLVFVTMFLESSVFFAWSSLPTTGRILSLLVGGGFIGVALLGIQSLLLNCDAFLERDTVWLFVVFLPLLIFSVWRFAHSLRHAPAPHH